MNLYTELKRRNVFKVAIAYIVVAWLLLQVAEILVPALRLPDWVLSATLYFLIIGFFPALIFAWAFELTPEGLKKEKDVDRGESITHVTGRKLDFAIIGLLAIAVVYLVLDKLKPEEAADPATVVEAAPAESVAAVEDGPPPKSIAVLPFANMSEDAGNEFFADGISEEILNALAKVKNLKVAGRTSSFAFKGRNEDLRLIGETLDVSHILEGSVRKAGNTVRVTAQLIAVEDGYHLWSETYDRELTDIFAIQDEISAAILAELKAELMGEEQVASARTDPRAYEKYLQARQLIYTRRTAKLEDARTLLDEAIALDEDFAPAWAQRGILAKLLSEEQYGTIPFADSLAQSRSYLEHALALDEGLAEGWAGLGLYYTSVGGPDNQRLAREYLERALSINPNYLDASNWLYAVLIQEYRLQEGLAVLEGMFERDPLYPPLLGNLDLSYVRLGQKEKLAGVLDRVRPFTQGSPQFERAMASHLAAMGDGASALPFAEDAYQKAPEQEWVAAALQRVLFFLHEHDRALEIQRSNPVVRMRILQYLGRNEEAIILARQFFEATGRPHFYIEALAKSGQYKALIAFVEGNWNSLQAFHSENEETIGFGYPSLIFLAEAYRANQQYDRFEEAMQLLRSDHDRQIAAGVGWGYFYMLEAQYWTLANDHERAIDNIELAANDDIGLTPRLSRMWPLLKPLEGDPRFEAAQARMLDNLNRQRVEAGLESLAPAYEL